MMLGKRIWLMLGFSVSMLLVIRLQKNGNARQLRFLLVLAALVLVAYLFPTLNRSKNPFFGLTFQILLFFFMISGWNLFFLGAQNGHTRFLGPAFTTLLPLARCTASLAFGHLRRSDAPPALLPIRLTAGG